MVKVLAGGEDDEATGQVVEGLTRGACREALPSIGL